MDAERSILSKRAFGDEVWPMDSLEFVAILNGSSSADACDICFSHKRGVNKPIGCVESVSRKDGHVDQVEKILRGVASRGEKSEFAVAKEVARIDTGMGKPYLILLDNRVILSRYRSEFRAVHLRPGTELAVSRGGSPLAKHVEITPPPSSGEPPLQIKDVNNAVNLRRFLQSVQEQAPDVTVADTSRSALSGWFLCFGLPVLGTTALMVVSVGLACKRRAANDLTDVSPEPRRRSSRGRVISCSGCDRRLRIRQGSSSSRVRCPECNSVTRIA